MSTKSKYEISQENDKVFEENKKLINAINDNHRKKSHTDLRITIRDTNWYDKTNTVSLSYTNWPNTEIQHINDNILKIPHGQKLTEEQLNDIIAKATEFEAELYQTRWAR